MENYRVYGRHSEEHAERTKPDNLPDGFKETLQDFNDKTVDGCIIDIGCGTGRDLQYMKNLHGEQDMYGLDASRGMIEQAKKNTDSSIQYLVSDMSNIPLRSGTVDGLWCQAAIFMVDLSGMEKTLREFNRILSDDGIGSVSFKIADGESDQNGHQTRERWGDEVQYYFVDEDIARSLVSDAGFSIDKVERSVFKDNVFLNIWFSV